MPVPNRIIYHPAELAALSVLPLMQPQPRGAIRIETAAVERDTRLAWEKQLNRAYHACGCGEASLGGLTGLIASGIWAGVRAADGAGFGWSEGLIVAGCTVAGIILGKMAGLLRAQARLKALVKTIRAEWKAEPRTVADDECG